MKLLLKKDISKLGIVGDIVNVSDGYARNYLLPKGLAMEPTEGNMRAIAKERAAAAERRRLHREEMQGLADKLQEVEITISAAANDEGHLYGSVGTKEIAASLIELGHAVTEEHVKLDEPIRNLDNVRVRVVLAEDIETEVKVWVVREGAAPAQDEEQTTEETVEE